MSSSAQQLTEWLTTKDVAEYYDVPQKKVLRMIHQERLKAERMGWVWVVHRDNLPAIWPPPRVK